MGPPWNMIHMAFTREEGRGERDQVRDEASEMHKGRDTATTWSLKRRREEGKRR